MAKGGKHRADVKRPLWVKLLVGLLVLVLLLAGLAYGFYRYAKHDIESRITTEKILTDYQRPKPKPEKHDALNFLILGSDTREGENGKDIGGETPGLSDTAILLHIAQNRKFSYGVSIPRDSMVERPECPRKDGNGVAPAEFAMFNSAYALGGAPCTLKTVEVLTGVPIDHFLVIDFSGFKKVIDHLGGVEICVPEEVNDPIGNIHLKAGTYTMDGKTALDYVRVRHGIGAELGDIGRMKRQQSFMAAVLAKLMDQDVLGDPVQTYNLATAIADNLTSDEEFANVDKMLKLANSLKSLGANNIKFFTVPFELWDRDRNRIVWTEEASLIWEYMIEDKRLTKKILEDAVSPEDKLKSGKSAPKNNTSGPAVKSEEKVDTINGIC